MASYGSGNTMIVLSGRVAAQAPQVISRWDLSAIRGSSLPAGLHEYNIWSTGSYMRNSSGLSLQDPIRPPGHFYLSRIREDGYREYRPAAEYRESGPASAAPAAPQAPAAPAELLQSARAGN
jgi:hydroxymethylglutaryl-CoA synthase